MKNFNEISRKYVTYVDIESHKKTRFHPHSTKHIFGKTTGGWGVKLLPPSLLPVFLGMKGLIFSLKSQGIPKLRQTSIISEKPGFLSEKLKTLTSSNHHKF